MTKHFLYDTWVTKDIEALNFPSILEWNKLQSWVASEGICKESINGFILA